VARKAALGVHRPVGGLFGRGTTGPRLGNPFPREGLGPRNRLEMPGGYLEALLRSSEAVYERLMTRTGRGGRRVSSQRLAALRAQITGLTEAIDEALA
jgi:hypothetical protein